QTHSRTASATRDSSTVKIKKTVLTRDVTRVLDTVNMSDRNATFVIAATVNALGHDLNSTSPSRSTVRRSRMINREIVAKEDKATFNITSPVLLHWDGKLLPNTVNGKEKVDRIAILIS